MKKDKRAASGGEGNRGDTSMNAKYFLWGWIALLVVAAACVAFRL